MAEVWRYPIKTGANTIDMPPGARVVRVGVARGQASLWAIVEEDGAPHEPRRFLVVATGQSFPGNMAYLGTFEPEPGYFFHLFE